MLWKKVMPRLSAGRVQSVATRMVVERERARMRFRSASWWGVEGTFAAPGAAGATTVATPTEPASFGASLVAWSTVPAGHRARLRATAGRQTTEGQVRVLAETEARALADALARRGDFTVRVGRPNARSGARRPRRS